MSYRLPPLNGLKAFEAAARHLSFKAAAEELSVTPGAVSQQVKSLEAALGLPLFRRLHRALVLTAAGEAYLPAISEAFHQISAATDDLGSDLRGRKLRFGVSPRLAADPGALLRRLSADGGSGDVVSVSATEDMALLIDGSLDAMLRPGPGSYPGLHAETLALHEAFAPNEEAALIVHPGLARCREVTAVKELLCRAQTGADA